MKLSVSNRSWFLFQHLQLVRWSWSSLRESAAGDSGHTGRQSGLLDDEDVPGPGWSPGWPQGTAGLIQAPNRRDLKQLWNRTSLSHQHSFACFEARLWCLSSLGC